MFIETAIANEEVGRWFNYYNTHIAGQKTKFLWMMIGVAAAGKSTVIERHLYKPGIIVISTDNIIENIAQACGTTYSDIFDKVSSFVGKYSLQMVRDAINESKDIVWDQTNLTAKSRKKKLDMFPKHYYKVGVYVETPEISEIMRRNDLRSKSGKFIPHNVLNNMIQSLEIPSHQEGFDEIWLVDKNGNIYGNIYHGFM